MDAIWVVALIVWVLSAVIKKAGGRGGGESELPRPRARRTRVARPPRPIPEEVPDPRVADWQREIEELLGVRTGPAGGPLGRPSGVPLPEAEEVEERESLEVEERVVSAEAEGDRPVPEVRDQDDEADVVIRRRLAVAEAHGRGRTAADHARTDQLLRTPAEAPRAALRPARPSLRQAFVWREILGPPLALRDGPRDPV